MFKSLVQSKAAKYVADLRDAAIGIVAQLTELSRVDRLDVERQAMSRAEGAANRMRAIATDAETRLANLAAAAREADQTKRSFQAQHGIVRDLKRPNALVATFLVMLGWLIESVFTATGLFADGHVDLIPAMGFAVTFSTANVGLGLAAGFCLRYLSYRGLHSSTSSTYLYIRGFAAAGLILLVALILLMIFVGGRVRVTGGHDGIFDFSEATFAATFGDGLALVIMVSAGLSFAISVFKGFCGFADPIPGYADHSGREIAGIDDAAYDLASEAEDQISDIRDDIEDEVFELIEGEQDEIELLEDVLAFNVDVLNAKDAVRVFAHTEWESRSFIEGKSIPRSVLNMDALDALLIDADAVMSGPVRPEILDSVREAHAEATGRIWTAYAAYQAEIRRVHSAN